MLSSNDSAPIPKLLITGASGFLGWYLCQVAQSNWQVFGTAYSHAVEIPGCSMVTVDLCDFASLKQVLQTVQPDAVIHAAAQARPHICQAEPQTTHAINVEVSWTLADLCGESQIPLLFVSTDLVFDGQDPPYQESDPVSPISTYGEQKVKAEQGMVERYPLTVIARMPLMFGAAPHAASFIQPMIQNLEAGKALQLFEDEFRTPVSGLDAARGILMALAKGEGYVHLGGKERLSRYEMGQQLVDCLGYPPTLLTGCSQTDVSLSAPRPADVSLDSSLAYSLGYAPNLFDQALRQMLGQS